MGSTGEKLPCLILHVQCIISFVFYARWAYILRMDRHIDLKRLQTFVTVSEQGTVSKAALLLRITQPALSRQLQDLQDELGVKLFERVGRRLLLTRR